jgi:OOP family OmpA-OmpF porin
VADSAAARDGWRRRYDSEPPEREGPDDSMAELRALLVGPEQRELRAVQAHVFDPSVQTRDVSRVLPDAIELRARDPHLMRALAPSIEQSITTSVRRDPRPLADALFPVMGPAIRKAIAHTLASMMESLNRTLELSLSWRAVRWRWTAFRTGKPFAEIVLLNTLQYRVEQVILIHSQTGLVLQHLSLDPRAALDAEQLSGMLTAIRDFVRDWSRTSGDDSVDALPVGDFVVLVEQGPDATLAALVRGTPPSNLRTVLQNAVESVHLQAADELQAFRGDAGPFERVRPILETCLVAQFRPAERTRSYRRWVAAAALVVLALGVWLILTARERQRWNDFVQRLRSEPGIVVVASGRRDGRYFVEGLRDPLSADPAAVQAASPMAGAAIDGRWEPYQAIQPDFVVTRAHDLLKPPGNVKLAYHDGVLTASGDASEGWIAESERLAPAIAGVRRFEYTGPPPELRLQGRLEAIGVRFSRGQSRLAPDQAASVQAAAVLLNELNQTLRLHGQRARVEVVGHTDSDGSDSQNEPLSRARAETVVRMVPAPLLDALDLSATGVGASQPLTSGSTEAEKEQNRRVSFRVTLSERPTVTGGRR